MTGKQFYDWQTRGGTDDVMRLVDCLERPDVAWCVVDGLAVNHWAQEPMVTLDVDFVVAVEAIERTVSLPEEAGFQSERFEWSVSFKGRSAISIRLSTEDFYRDFPSRAVPADVHGILMRVASLDDALRGKIKAWSEPQRRQSKRIKDLADIARLVEAHPHLWDLLTDDLKCQLLPPGKSAPEINSLEWSVEWRKRMWETYQRQCMDCKRCHGLLDSAAFPLSMKSRPKSTDLLFIREAPNRDDTYNPNKHYITVDSQTDPSGMFFYDLFVKELRLDIHHEISL